MTSDDQKESAPRRSSKVAARPTAVGANPASSREARRIAAVVLEVLAGERTPAQAAQALAMCLPKYYHVELRALHGLVAACEPRPLGRQATPASELAKLRRQQLQRDYARQQALVRATQRTVGLAPPPAPAARAPGKKRKHKPKARALTLAAQLQPDVAVAAGPPSA
jgi:hypothetical protein